MTPVGRNASGSRARPESRSVHQGSGTCHHREPARSSRPSPLARDAGSVCEVLVFYGRVPEARRYEQISFLIEPGPAADDL